MTIKGRHEVRGLRTEANQRRGTRHTLPQPSALSPQSSKGFTLVEMIMVIVITGIIGGIVAVFLQAPMKQYMDVARRADMTDIADTALRRISRDVRLALPNSVRVRGAISGVGSCNGSEACFLEFLPTLGGARYCAAAPCVDLDFASADTSFDVLGTMPPAAVGDQVVVYNLGIPGADAYTGNTLATDNRRAISVVGAGSLSITSANALPFESPGHRFHVISTPVTYVCDGAGTVWRYWGYPIQDEHDKTDSIAELDALIPDTNHRARLATNVSSCRFTYDPLVVVSARNGLVTMHLTITEANPDGGNETVTLYNAAHVSNQP